MSQESNENSSNPGLFIIKGMQLTVSGFSFRINAEGGIEADPISVSTDIDLCPYWLNIALGHLLHAEQANNVLIGEREKETEDPEKIANALETEFTSGMQTIMASAIAIDAYYARIKERIEIIKELSRIWRENKISRDKQIAEVIRIAFPMKNESVKKLRNALKEIFRFRGMAVHPPSGNTQPQLHPEFNKITDWRYVAFRYFNAKAAAGLSLSIISQSAIRPSIKHKDLKPYCDTLLPKLEPILNQWNISFGKLDYFQLWGN
jgi:hypothetical protein